MQLKKKGKLKYWQEQSCYNDPDAALVLINRNKMLQNNHKCIVDLITYMSVSECIF